MSFMMKGRVGCPSASTLDKAAPRLAIVPVAQPRGRRVAQVEMRAAAAEAALQPAAAPVAAADELSTQAPSTAAAEAETSSSGQAGGERRPFVVPQFNAGPVVITLASTPIDELVEELRSRVLGRGYAVLQALPLKGKPGLTPKALQALAELTDVLGKEGKSYVAQVMPGRTGNGVIVPNGLRFHVVDAALAPPEMGEPEGAPATMRVGSSTDPRKFSKAIAQRLIEQGQSLVLAAGRKAASSAAQGVFLGNRVTYTLKKGTITFRVTQAEPLQQDGYLAAVVQLHAWLAPVRIVAPLAKGGSVSFRRDGEQEQAQGSE